MWDRGEQRGEYERKYLFFAFQNARTRGLKWNNPIADV